MGFEVGGEAIEGGVDAGGIVEVAAGGGAEKGLAEAIGGKEAVKIGAGDATIGADGAFGLGGDAGEGAVAIGPEVSPRCM